MKDHLSSRIILLILLLSIALNLPLSVLANDQVSTMATPIKYNKVEETPDGMFHFTYSIQSSKSVVLEETYLIPFSEEARFSIRKELAANERYGVGSTQIFNAVENDSTNTYRVTLTSTAEYKKKVGTLEYWILKKVQGKIEGLSPAASGNYLGSGVYLKSQSLLMVTDGAQVGGGDLPQHKTVHPTTTTWTKYPPSTWEPVNVSVLCNIGAKLTVKTQVGTNGTIREFVLWSNVFNN